MLNYAQFLPRLKSWASLRRDRESLIITAYHCISLKLEDENMVGTKINYITYADMGDGESVSTAPRTSIVLAVDPGNDMALLHVAFVGLNIPHKFVKVYKGKIESGQRTNIIGHPLAFGFTYMSGYVSSIRNIKGPLKTPMKLLQVSAPILRGVSGGGLFEVETGQLLGICSFSVNNSGSISFFIHRDSILSFLSENKLL